MDPVLKETLEYLFCCLFDGLSHPKIEKSTVKSGETFVAYNGEEGLIVLFSILEESHNVLSPHAKRYNIAQVYDKNGNLIEPLLIRKKDTDDIIFTSWAEAVEALAFID